MRPDDSDVEEKSGDLNSQNDSSSGNHECYETDRDIDVHDKIILNFHSAIITSEYDKVLHYSIILTCHNYIFN